MKTPNVEDETYDLVILGSGSAAFAAAIRASELGKRAVLIEKGRVGGTCVNVGCVPSKHLLVAGEQYRSAQSNPFRALRCRGESLDFPTAIKQKEEVVATLQREKYVDVADALEGVDLVHGFGALVSPREVRVNGQALRGRSFLIATGSTPWAPSLPGLEDAGHWSNVEALAPNERPDSLLIVGGRALGLEFASMYSHFGTEVTLLQRSERIIPEEEPECSEALQRALEEGGVTILTQATPKEVRREDGKKVIVASVQGETKRFEADEILMATGRRPNTEGLGLEEIGVRLGGRGEVVVNGEMRTSVDHVYAAGDVRGGEFLETTAAKEGFVAAENALADAHRKMDPSEHVPRAIFTDPQFAAVGYSEEAYSARTGACACRTVPMDLVPKARIVGDTRGVIKMTVDPKDKRVVGVQIVSALAADMIHEATLAVKFGLTIDDIIDTVHVFPTYSEALKLGAQAFYKDVSKLSCCTQ